MRGYGRQDIRESEAVGQEDIRTLHPEFLLIELLPIEDVTRERLRGTDVRIVGIPAAARHMPAPQLDILLHCLVFQRVVLLHPGILHTPLKVEDIVRVPTQQVEVRLHRLRHIFTDGFLYIPVPLGIEMRIRHHISLLSPHAQEGNAHEKSQ